MTMPMMSMMPMMMPMVFRMHTSASFLIKEWRTSTLPGLIGAMVFSTTLAILFEGVQFYIATSTRNSSKTRSDSKRRRLIIRHCLVTLLKMLTLTSGYVMMLCVMTYNVWILVSIILGAGIGHFVIRPLVFYLVFESFYKPKTNGIELHDGSGYFRKEHEMYRIKEDLNHGSEGSALLN